MRHSIWLLGAVLLAACGPAGIISGRVTVEGGTAAGLAVIVYGPQSAAAVTGEDGAFSVGSLPDGKYVVHATLRGADVEELNTTTSIAEGKQVGDVVLSFRASTAKITGRVVMADASGANNLTVTAVGPETRGVRTAADGAFTFEGLKTGAYVVSVEAPDTREGRVSVGVSASGPSGDAGELRLTPVGRLSGTVLFSGSGVAGAPVVVTGTNLSTVTDAMGRFSLVEVPTGNQAVQVRVGTSPFFRSATEMVTVVRGANPDLSITLTDDAPPTGTVTGVVTFHGPRTPRDIILSVPGAGVMPGSPLANGQFSLTLPIGVWEVMASAPQHPARSLGRVTVLAGRVQVLPGAELSWWRPLWQASTSISVPSTVATATGTGAATETVPWSLVTFFDSNSRLALVNASTGELRLLASGSTSGHRISKTGKYAGWFVNQTAFVYEIGTATLQTFATLASPTQNVMRIEFSTDESALFIQRSGTLSLTRVKFATPMSPETFPPSGAATEIQVQTVDRWFVRDSTNAVRLVTPTIDVPSVFTNITSFSTTPTAWALTNCVTTCELWVHGPTSNTTGLRDLNAASNVALGNLNNFAVFGWDNRADYPCFRDATLGTAFCVKSSDATHYPLAAVPSIFRLNELGDRVIWTATLGGVQIVREEPMPPTSTTNLDSNAVGWNVGWISPTRAYAYEVSGAPRKLRLVKAGVGSVDPDVGSQTISVNGPLLHFPQSSTSQWRAYVGDGPVRVLPVATNIPATGTSARPLNTGAITKYAAISYDTVNAYILDENTSTVRQTSAGYAGQRAFRSGATELWDISRIGAVRAYYVFSTNVLLEYQDPAVTSASTAIGAIGVSAYLGLSEDGRTIQLGSFVP